MSEPGKVSRRHPCAGDVVDADRRDRLVVEAEIQRNERKPAIAGQLDQPRAALEAEHDEAVDQRALDIPGELLLVDADTSDMPAPVASQACEMPDMTTRANGSSKK